MKKKLFTLLILFSIFTFESCHLFDLTMTAWIIDSENGYLEVTKAPSNYKATHLIKAYPDEGYKLEKIVVQDTPRESDIYSSWDVDIIVYDSANNLYGFIGKTHNIYTITALFIKTE